MGNPNPYELNGYDLRKVFQDRDLSLTERYTVIALICWLTESGGGNIPTREFATLSGQSAGNIGKQLYSLISKEAITADKRANTTHKDSWAIDQVKKYRIDQVIQPPENHEHVYHIKHEELGRITVTVAIPFQENGKSNGKIPEPI